MHPGGSQTSSCTGITWGQLKHNCWDPPSASRLRSPGWGPSICIPSKLPPSSFWSGGHTWRTTGLSHLELRIWGYSMEPKGFRHGLFARLKSKLRRLWRSWEDTHISLLINLSVPLPHHSPHPVGENSVEGGTELIEGVMGIYIILELMKCLSEFCFLAQACPGHCSIPMV